MHLLLNMTCVHIYLCMTYVVFPRAVLPFSLNKNIANAQRINLINMTYLTWLIWSYLTLTWLNLLN